VGPSLVHIRTTSRGARSERTAIDAGQSQPSIMSLSRGWSGRVRGMSPKAVPFGTVIHGTARLAEGKYADATVAWTTDHEERKHY
jgi:hypothetical protein